MYVVLSYMYFNSGSGTVYGMYMYTRYLYVRVHDAGAK